MSETASCRKRLSQFCVGNGLDIGAGGDSIVPTAICIDREEMDKNRAHEGKSPTHLVGDAASLVWFRNNVLDYVFSSHCLEDFPETTPVLSEWLRVIRPGGLLVLFLPDQKTYVGWCKAHNSLPNQAHKHENFSLGYVKSCLFQLGYSEADIVHQAFPVYGNAYSFDLVVRKHS